MEIDYAPLGKYKLVVYATSYVNPIDDAMSIESQIAKDLPEGGHILFDMLLSNGDTFNRFAEAYFDGHSIQRNSMKVVSIRKPAYIRRLNAHYKGRPVELNNSVLSPRERLHFCKT